MNSFPFMDITLPTVSHACSQHLVAISSEGRVVQSACVCFFCFGIIEFRTYKNQQINQERHYQYLLEVVFAQFYLKMNFPEIPYFCMPSNLIRISQKLGSMRPELIQGIKFNYLYSVFESTSLIKLYSLKRIIFRQIIIKTIVRVLSKYYQKLSYKYYQNFIKFIKSLQLIILIQSLFDIEKQLIKSQKQDMKVASNKQSNITFTFGENIASKDTPVDFEMVIDVFSKKHENIRFNLQEMLDIEIRDNTFVVELIAKGGFGSQLADKIMTQIKSSKKYQQHEAKTGLNIKVFGKGEKAYLLIWSPILKGELAPVIEQLEKHKDKSADENNQIKLSIKSSNSFAQMRKVLDNQGILRSMLDSLWLNFTFKKTKMIEIVLASKLNQIAPPGFSNMLNSFDHLNLEVDLASSSTFDNFQKLRAFTMVQNKRKFELLHVFKDQYQQNAKFHFFNPSLSLSGSIVAEGLQELLDALYE